MDTDLPISQYLEDLGEAAVLPRTDHERQTATD